jgi:hypothetical protein
MSFPFLQKNIAIVDKPLSSKKFGGKLFWQEQAFFSFFAGTD